MFGTLGFKSSQANAIIDPSSIFGANLVAWYRGDSLVNTSGSVGTWNDKTANGNNLTATGTAQPTYNSSSANFNNQPTASFNGTSNVLTKGGMSGGGTGSTYYVFTVFKITAGTALSEIINIASVTANRTTLYMQTNSATEPGSLFTEYGTTLGASGSMNWSATDCSASVLAVGGAGTIQTYLNEDNLDNLNVGVSSATNPTWANSELFVGGSGVGGVNFINGEIAEIVVVNITPATKQTNQLYKYAQNRYNVDPAITATSITNVSTSGGTARINGTGFNISTTVSNTVLGSLTVKYISSTIIEVTIPAASAGLYDVTITNTNTGLTYTKNSFINVVSSATFDPMVILGTTCVGWYMANQITSGASGASAITDQSLLGNTLSQSTAVDQPTLNATDAAFNNQATLSFNGTSQYLATTAFNMDTTSISAIFMFAVGECTSSSGEQTFGSYNSQQTFLELSSGTPRCGRGGNVALYGSTQTNVAKNFSGWIIVGSPGTVAVSVDNTSTVTASGTIIAPILNSAMAMGAETSPADYLTGKMACYIVCNAVPTSTQRANLQTWANGRFGT